MIINRRVVAWQLAGMAHPAINAAESDAPCTSFSIRGTAKAGDISVLDVLTAREANTIAREPGRGENLKCLLLISHNCLNRSGMPT